MSSVALKAEKREKFGTAESRRIKNAGRIPAVIYAKEGNLNFTIDAREFEKEYYKGTGLTTVVEIELEGKKIKAIAHKIELDPVSDAPIHVDFLTADKDLRAKPRLVFANQDKSPGIKKGGFLHVVLRRVEVVCENEKSVPNEILVDVGVMQVGSKVRANNLKLPAGVKLAKKDNFLIASIIGRGKAEEENPAAAAAAAPAAGAAAPAAGAAAPAKEEKKADKK